MNVGKFLVAFANPKTTLHHKTWSFSSGLWMCSWSMDAGISSSNIDFDYYLHIYIHLPTHNTHIHVCRHVLIQTYIHVCMCICSYVEIEQNRLIDKI